MSDSPSTPAFARLHALRMAVGEEQQQRHLAALNDVDLRHLVRSLEFQSILDGAAPDLLDLIRPRLRQLRPARLGSVERLCWRPLEQFLTDQAQADGDMQWQVPRRLLTPLWHAIEDANTELVEQLRRQHLLACFDGDAASLDIVSNRIIDLAAYFLNNNPDLPARLHLSPGEEKVATFIAQVMKWHRLLMPNVRYFQQVAATRRSHGVEALRLYSNWYTLFERLDGQFDLYLLYLFTMTPDPIHVIDAFPFHFETLGDTDGLAARWLLQRIDQLARDVAGGLAAPPRQQRPETLLAMAVAVKNFDLLLGRLQQLPAFRQERPDGRHAGATLRRRLPHDHVERLCDSYIDDLHDMLRGDTDRKGRAQQVLAPLSTVLPRLLTLLDTGERGSRAARARFRLGDKVVEEVGRHLRSHELAPKSRARLQVEIGPALAMCERFGMSEAAADLSRKLARA